MDRSSLSFWFGRSEFYVTGINFVCSRVAIMSQLTVIAYYIEQVCKYEAPDRNGDNEGDGTPYWLAVAQGLTFLASFVYSICI